MSNRTLISNFIGLICGIILVLSFGCKNDETFSKAPVPKPAPEPAKPKVAPKKPHEHGVGDAGGPREHGVNTKPAPAPATGCLPLEGPPELPGCGSGTGRDGVNSSAPVVIGLVVDADSSTMRRGKGGKWDYLQGQAWNVTARLHKDKSGQPLYQTMPTYCETIQRMGGLKDKKLEAKRLIPCIPQTKRKNAQARGSARLRSYTPASKALNKICRLLRTNTNEGGWTLGMLAFDGVIDARDVNNPTTPAKEFSEEVGICVKAGVSVQVVALPSRYEYVYVMAAPGTGHAKYAGVVAAWIAKAMTKEYRGSAPVVLPLTPVALLDGVARNTVANAKLTRLKLQAIFKGKQESGLAQQPRTGGQGKPSVARINTHAWAARQGTNRAAWRLQWKHAASAWNGLAPGGTVLPPPEVHLNQELAGSGAPSGAKPDVLVPRVKAALSRQDIRTKTWSKDKCGAQAKNRELRLGIYNSLAVFASNGAPLLPGQRGKGSRTGALFGVLELELIKNSEGDFGWLEDIGAEEGFKKVKDKQAHVETFLEKRRGSRYLASLLKTTRTPLPAMALVSPALERDPCSVDLSKKMLEAHSWAPSDTSASMLKDLDNKCINSSLKALVTAFKATGYRRFELTGKPRLNAPKDYRAGMVTLALAVSKTAEAVLGSSRADLSAARGACILQGVQVVLEAPAKGKKPARRKP